MIRNFRRELATRPWYRLSVLGAAVCAPLALPAQAAQLPQRPVSIDSPEARDILVRERPPQRLARGDIARDANGKLPWGGERVQSRKGAPPLKDSTASFDTSYASAPWVWRNIGPARIGGYVDDIAVPLPRTPDDPRAGTTMYIAAPGGVFKTEDGGSRWKPLLDREAVTAASRVVVAPSDPNVVWVATGNFNVTHEAHPGRGLLKSTDAGAHWTPAGFERAEYIGALAIHPRDANVVYAGVMGPLTHASRERGVYKTRDGGKSWTQVHYVNEWTGVVDLAIDPSNPNTLYAVTWQQAVTPHIYVDFGAGSGIYKSTDAGASWRRLTNGLPVEELGRTGIAVSPASPNIVYAIVDEAGKQAPKNPIESNVIVYRSFDHGEHWQRGERGLQKLGTGAYFGRVWADPQTPARVYVGSRHWARSSDSGRTLVDLDAIGAEDTPANVPSADSHALWINPQNSAHIVMGNDRGVFISENRARTWRHVESLPLARLWALGADTREFFYNIYPVIQDSWGFVGPSRSRTIFGIRGDEWRKTSAGERGAVVPDLADAAKVYVLWPKEVGLFNTETQNETNIFPLSPVSDTTSVGEVHHSRVAARMSVHSPGVMYRGSDRVWKLATNGSWARPISPAFASRLPDSATIMGRFERSWPQLLAAHNRWLEARGLTTAMIIEGLAESPVDSQVLYAGTQSGVLMVTRDGGRGWQRTAPRPAAPADAPVSSVVASHFDKGTAYTTTRAGRHGDRRPHVFKTTDYGASWTRISGSLPEGAVVWELVEHFRTPGLLFAGTDDGVYASIDDGAHWAKLGGNIPQAGRVRNLLIQRAANDLVVSVWGRGVWILDDLTPLEHWAEATRSSRPYLFPIRNAVRFQGVVYSDDNSAAQEVSTPNLPYGALITYWVPEAARGQRDTIEILNAQGELVRAFETDPTPGFHRFAWDLRWAKLDEPASVAPPPSNISRSLAAYYESRKIGPEVRPGSYIARFQDRGVALAAGAGARAAQAPYERRFTVVRDPQLRLSAAAETVIDTEARLAQELQIELAVFTAVSEALRTQLDSAQWRLEQAGPSAAALAATAAKLRKQIDTLRSPLTSAVTGAVDWRTSASESSGATTPLLEPQRERVEEARNITARQRDELRALIAGPMATFVANARQAAGQAVAVDPQRLLARITARPIRAVSRAVDYTEPLVDEWMQDSAWR